ncbi:helix-turn-helix transcriptional regulator [uncultured Nevskia sp.]|uniref:helix-turn-helix transcriptional regulator n=1 Tax=uncultured Nevskia sp. TaxID=228950 RepID=UPI0025D62A1A|nr:helix-turn-helix transcriptional regulator [uncultured Nevskia sp.]
MEPTDELINALYRSAIEEECQDYRPKALARLCERLGASRAAWWSRGVGTSGGELTQHPPGQSQTQFTPQLMAALPFTSDQTEASLEVPMRGQIGLALQYRHRDSGVISTVLMQFPPDRKLPAAEPFRRVLAHMVEAGALALRQFIRRDDWLQAMGRANRGSAAMVDAEGSVFAASERFREMLGEDQAAPILKLPFELPESTLGDEGGDFIHAPLHIRVRRSGQLYLIYARKPLPLDMLSPREQEIARALGNGKTLKSIARQYGIAVSTVANHTTRIYRKLAIYRREDLIDLIRLKASKP